VTEHEHQHDAHEEVWRAILTGKVRGLNMTRRLVGWIPAVPYVGRVGEGDACDFTAVGDPVNTTARLASSAAAGEILVTASAASASGLDTGGLEMRTLSLRGREETTEVWVAKP
jgi:hypothetical protein